MGKKRLLSWGIHLRQDRVTYVAILAVVAAFGTALIVVGGLQVQSSVTAPDLWGNPLVDIGLVIIVIAAIGTLILAFIPMFLRPKLCFGPLYTIPYGPPDPKLVQMAMMGGGLKEANMVAVEVVESVGIRALDTEVWMTDVTPRPSPIQLPKQLEVSDSRSTYGDVPAGGRSNFILWVAGSMANGGRIGYSRTGWYGTDTATVTLEIRREGQVHETRQFSVPDDIVSGIPW